MNDHPTGEQLALYVMDALEADESRALEAHVALCAPCGAQLAREAQVELALAEAGRATASAASGSARTSNVTPLVRRPALRWAFAAAASLLVALGGVHALRSSRHAAQSPLATSGFVNLDDAALARSTEPARTLETAVACLDAHELDACLHRERAQGRMVQLPAQPVPKYEELAMDAPRPAPLGAWRPLVEGE